MDWITGLNMTPEDMSPRWILMEKVSREFYHVGRILFYHRRTKIENVLFRIIKFINV
jgi:hypothetical protein